MANIALKNDCKINTLPDKQNQREFITRRTTLQEILTGVLHFEMKEHQMETKSQIRNKDLYKGNYMDNYKNNYNCNNVI